MKKLLIALVLVASSAQAEQLICPVLDIYQAKSTNDGLVYTKESTNVQSVPFNAKVDSTVIEITKLDYVVVQAYKDYNEFRSDTGRAEYNAVDKTITYQTVNNKLEPVKLIWHCRGNIMAFESFDDLIKAFQLEPTETEVKAARHMQDFCIQNDLFFPDSVHVLSAFSGFDPNILLEKVNAVNTPVQEEYFNNSF